MSLAFVKLGGDQSRTEVSRRQAAVMISVALVKLGGDQSRTEVSRSHAAVMISVALVKLGGTKVVQKSAEVRLQS